MKNLLLSVIATGITLISFTQDTLPQRMEDVYIYSNKFSEKKKNMVQRIDVISAQRIAQFNAQNTGDLLTSSGNIFVQKSQQGGSSPVIRGFEASRVLLVVDGIRMNNAIYRAGHLQNVITIDQNMLERVEVLYGPASTLYGSDALGGVVHFRTKMPKLSVTDRMHTAGAAMIRYSSANNEKSGHFDISIGGKKVAWLQSYNYSDFGDMKMGSNYHDDYPNFGRRTHYITNFNGIDSVVANSDDRVQKFSGYRQWDITQKVFFQQSDRITHLLNVQYSNSSNVPRYDRLQDVRNGNLRYAEWYYGPQLRTLAAYEFNLKGAGPMDELRSIISYQHIEESRHQREYRRYDRLDNRYEDLDVLALTVDARKMWDNHELTVGTDAQLNDVQSKGIRRNIITGAESKIDSRYPDGNNNMNYFGVYAQHLLKLAGGKLVLNDGIRFQYNSLRSTIADNSFFNFPFTEIEQDNFAVTGNLGLIYHTSENSRISLGLATGFRAPNIDDLSRIFESNTASRQLIVPNPQIKPEYTYNADLGIMQKAGKMQLEITGFYTWFRNAIALAPFQLNGEDSVDYNGIRTKVFANQNVNTADVYGVNANLTADLAQRWKLSGTVTLTKGKLHPAGGSSVPLDHIPPVYGKAAVNYYGNKLGAELYMIFNGWKRIGDYNPSGEDNAQYATTDGTPSWATLNFKSTYRVMEKLSLQFGIDNILDRNYRPFASGFSAGGRNVVVAVRGNF